MKKLVCMAVALMLAIAVFAPFKAIVKAEETPAYDVTIPEGGNLATNPYNWAVPTLSAADFEVSENGVKLDNFVKDQQATTVFNGGRFGEFKLSMYADLHFNLPPRDMNPGEFYSTAFITFLIDRDQDDILAEDGKPWYAHKVYASLEIGLIGDGNNVTPVCRFMYYNAFAGNCSHTGQNYGGTNNPAVAAKLLDENTKHWLEIEVKNFEEIIGEGESYSGKIMKAYIDGEEAAFFSYIDGEYKDKDTNRYYQVNVSELDGAIGMFAQSSWPGGRPTSYMKNYLTVEKMTLISYDNNPDGEYVPQCTEPVFEITSKTFVAGAGYMVGDPIEIPLSDLFNYEGTKEVTYEVTSNGQPIGNIVNGFWGWTPSEPGAYHIDFKATVSDDNQATNYVTLRIEGNASTPDAPGTSTPGTSAPSEDNGKGDKVKGCGNVMGTSFILGTVALALGALTLKKKQN